MMMNVLSEIKSGNIKIKGSHPAIITSKVIITYRQLEDKISLAANYFYSKGIREKNKIAILSSNKSEYIISILALWELNACIIPLNIRLTDTELSELINFSDADYLLINRNEGRISAVKIPQVIFPFNIEKPVPDFNTPGIDPDKISLIMFTSGVTAKPKGVMHSLNDLLNSTDNSQSLLHQTSNDKWLCSLPFYHIGGLSIIARSLRFGSSLVVPDSLQNEDLKFSFDKLNPAFASLVPTQLKRLLEANWKPNEDLRNLLLGGGLISEELVFEATSAGCNISNVYGSTETSAFVSANAGENFKRKPLSAGKALGKSRISVVDNNLNYLPRNTSGEILVESDALFHGYYNDGETTRKKLKDRKFLTGDVGYIDEEGDLFIEARRSDLIISGGENVNPVEVENVLNEEPNIRESCVFALPDKEWGQIVAAAVVLNGRLSIQEITAFMKEKIASYKIPKRFFPVKKIPKSSIGKIMREKVKEEITILLD